MRQIFDVVPKFEYETEEIDNGRFYHIDGMRLPSITTVLSYHKSKELEQWRQAVGEEQANKTSRLAANIGTMVHELAETYLKEGKLPSNILPDRKMHFTPLRPFLDRIGDIYSLEKVLYSKKLGVAGRSDCIGFFDDISSIVDFKTSRKPKTLKDVTHYFEQETAYGWMFMEMTGIKIEQLVIPMVFTETGTSTLFIEKPENYVKGLVRKIKEYNDANINLSPTKGSKTNE